MLINDSNGEKTIRTIYIHDAEIESFIFEREESTLSFVATQYYEKKSSYTFKFIGVVGFEMVSCDFWGKMPQNVFAFDYVKHNERILLPRLFGMQSSYDNNQNDKLNSKKEYIEVVFTFASGDTLTVACDSIVVE